MHRAKASDDVFRAIADPTRRAILDRLRAGPANAGALAADFLVADRRVGRERVYSVRPLPLQSVAGWLEGYRSFWQSSLTQLKRNLEEK